MIHKAMNFLPTGQLQHYCKLTRCLPQKLPSPILLALASEAKLADGRSPAIGIGPIRSRNRLRNLRAASRDAQMG